jgi:predicted RNase H-like HicB family nuclease
VILRTTSRHPLRTKPGKEVLDSVTTTAIRARIDGPVAQEYDVLIERDAEGNLVASVPALPECHTQAQSLDVLMERIKEAIALCLEERDRPPETLTFVGVQRVRVT